MDDDIFERAFWQFSAADRDRDGEISVTAHANGVLIEVEQEHAVDSYNSNFTSSVLLPWDQWDQLVATISAAGSSRHG